jgi:large subunit ribosomal protein L17
LAAALFLTERETDEHEPNAPKTKGRIITTLEKAKEVRPVVEKCITIARKALVIKEAAGPLGTTAERGTDTWKAWRKSPQHSKWAQAMAPVVTARRRVIVLLGDKRAAKLVFDTVAPRFADRDGGYTRILRLAKPRLGDAGTRALLEFVGQNDRVKQRAQKPAFEAAKS